MDGYTLGLMQLEFGNIEFYALFLDRILYNSRVEKVQQGYKDNTQKITNMLSRKPCLCGVNINPQDRTKYG